MTEKTICSNLFDYVEIKHWYSSCKPEVDVLSIDGKYAKKLVEAFYKTLSKDIGMKYCWKFQ